jgi:hypothetical protein
MVRAESRNVCLSGALVAGHFVEKPNVKYFTDPNAALRHTRPQSSNFSGRGGFVSYKSAERSSRWRTFQHDVAGGFWRPDWLRCLASARLSP